MEGEKGGGGEGELIAYPRKLIYSPFLPMTELDALGEDLSEMEGTPSYLMDTQPVGPMPELEPLPQGQEPSTAQSNPSKVS